MTWNIPEGQRISKRAALRKGLAVAPAPFPVLCTGKNEAAVRYALGGMDEQVFVCQYKILLPDEATQKAFIERERDLLG